MTTWSVVVVDDQQHWRDLLSLLLETDPRFVLAGTTEHGRAAIEKVRQCCPDAIILDVQMPEMDGLEALPLLRACCRQSVIVMYSSDPSGARTAGRLGADAVIDKVEAPGVVLDRLAELCVRRKR